MSIPAGEIEVFDLGRVAYRAAYGRQVAEVERVLAARDLTEGGGAAGQVGNLPHAARGGEQVGHPPHVGTILLVEHDPVITISNRPTAASHLTATPAMLERAGVAVEPTDRGGDITYHGPGQLVVYPILDLNRLHLRLHDYMRLLEEAVIRTLAVYGVEGRREAGATGVWMPAGGSTSKIAAMGVRVRKWVSMHGLALNVDPDLSHFDLIVPCGLAGRTVTSMRRVLGEAPAMEEVKRGLVRELLAQLSESR
ncbi:MAG: lipoyl(octanoyl) transferase LipB [Phycisphaerales bacterium]|nr:lipoyl(octanoyl) transferase LipB [Phycisphaerales bacterium]